MTTKAEVEAKCEEVSRLALAMQTIGMMNVAGKSPEERVAIDRDSRIARDRFFAAQTEYDSVFAEWRNAGYPET